MAGCAAPPAIVVVGHELEVIYLFLKAKHINHSRKPATGRNRSGNSEVFSEFFAQLIKGYPQIGEQEDIVFSIFWPGLDFLTPFGSNGVFPVDVDTVKIIFSNPIFNIGHKFGTIFSCQCHVGETFSSPATYGEVDLYMWIPGLYFR